MRRHRSVLAVTVAIIASLLPALTAHAQEADPVPPPKTRIVGGTMAGAGEFPFQAALFLDGTFRCGGTVVSKSWILTAGHCLYTDGKLLTAGRLMVVTGSNQLSTGGEELLVAAAYVHPSYHADPDLGDDVALLRLRRPTSSPVVEVIGSTPSELALDDPGVVAAIAGWGSLYSGGGPTEFLRKATVPITTDAACASAYPANEPDGYVFNATTMVCAGHPGGGIDSCQGDSGGPLLSPSSGGWRQVGVVSWGKGCADAGRPGVYSRLTHSRGWINNTRRYGPFAPDGLTFIDRQMRDFYGRPAKLTELVHWYNLFKTQQPSSLVITRVNGSLWQSNVDTIARLHKVATGSYPTTTAYNNWVPQRRKGVSLTAIAPWFAAAQANLSNPAYVDWIYQNAVGAGPSSTVRNIWIIRLQNGSWSRGDMLAYFAESATARTRLSAGVQVSSTWYGMMRLGPSETTVSNHLATSHVDLVNLLLHSYSYSYRFRTQ